jgi:hypothetical protein
MASKKDIDVNINATVNTSDIDKLNAKIDDIGKSVKNSEKATQSLANGFKGVGLAIKAAGIGLLLAAFNTLKEAFMANQKVADGFAAVMGTITSVVSQVVEVISKVIEKVSKSSNGFEGLTKVIGGLITIALTPLKASFYAISLAIDGAKLAWEESFFGDGDPKVIKALNERIAKTGESLKKVGTDAIDAGKTVVTNFGKAVGEIGAVVEGTIEGVSKIDIKASYEQSKAQISAANNAKLAEAAAARLAAQYETQAEKLRQLRDDDTKNIKDRIKANNDLAEVLDKQEKAMLAAANAQVAAAAQTLKQNKNIENQAALTNALAAKDQVLADIEGKRSEQKQNAINLGKEEAAMTQANIDGDAERALAQKKFNDERILDELTKLEAIKKTAEEERASELLRLEEKRKTYAEGTTARVEADKEYLARKQELDNAIILADDAIVAKQKDNLLKLETAQLDSLSKIAANTKLSFSDRKAALDASIAEIQASEVLSAEEKVKLEKDTNDKILALNKEKNEAIKQGIAGTLSAASDVAGAISAVNDAQMAKELAAVGDNFEKQEKIKKEYFEKNKKVQIAQAIIAAIQGSIGAFTSLAAIPVVGPVLGAIAAAAALVAGYANVEKIKATQYVGGTPPGGGGGGGSTPPPAPSMFAGGGYVSGTGTNSSDSIPARLSNGESVINANSTAMFGGLLSLINEAGGGKSFADGGMVNGSGNINTPVIKTYVVASDMTSQQEADFRIKQVARL